MTERCEHGTPLRARCAVCTEEAWAADHARAPWGEQQAQVDWLETRFDNPPDEPSDWDDDESWEG